MNIALNATVATSAVMVENLSRQVRKRLRYTCLVFHDDDQVRAPVTAPLPRKGRRVFAASGTPEAMLAAV